VRLRRIGAIAAAGAAGLASGAILTLAFQGTATIPAELTPTPTATPLLVPGGPDTFLVWIPGELPARFDEAVAAAEGVRRVVVVASDNTWLTRSSSAEGEVVDDPPPTFSIPLEVAAVDPRAYAPFLPPADRGVRVALENGLGVLGESSAKLRGLGPGSELRFGRVRVEIAAILPDELVGAHELLVSREVGLRIGVTHDRYALVVSEGAPNQRQVARAVRQVVGPGTLVRVRAPGETPYFRYGDAVLPPVRIKELFGEFAAKQRPGAPPGYLTFDPRWVRTHIDTQRVPLLGEVTCNVAMFPQIRGAIAELIELGLEDAIHNYRGCWAPRHILGDPDLGISHHAWGIAIDLNVPPNYFGVEPDQDPSMVAVFEDWGFIWGGDFIRPDGMHFEYRRPPDAR
jgi:hypothetical protein